MTEFSAGFVNRGAALRLALPLLVSALLDLIDGMCRIDMGGEPLPGTLDDQAANYFDELVAAIRATEACVGPYEPREDFPAWLRGVIDGRFRLRRET